MDPAWIAALCALATAVTGAALWCARAAWRLIRRVINFLDDFLGEPARAGVAARPGVMDRLSTLETSVASIAVEVHPNGGKSLRDEVQRMGTDMAGMKTGLRVLSERVERQIGGGR